MHRPIAIALSITPLLACARAPAPPSAAGCARPPDPPLSVAYRVREGAIDLFAGRSALDGGRDARVHATTAHNAAQADLELSARPTDAGTFLVRAHYEERSAEGARLEWQPEVRVRPGAPATVEITGLGWSRTLEVTVQ